MRNKKLTYLLGIVVIIIWGLIIFRIFISTKNDADLPIIQKTVAREPFNDYTIPADTSKLLLNYRDPFGVTKTKDSIKISKQSGTLIKALKLIPQMDWGFIRYSGYIQNPGSKKLVAVLIINGKSAMMTEGETNDDVKLIKNLKDSVRISFKGKSKFITMHKGN
jgi:hypothetical protein